MVATAQLDGRVVAVTGAARGIGLATAQALVRAGASVAMGDVDAATARSEAERLGARGFALDVTDRASFAAFLDATGAAFGPVDVLVNNAGIMPLGALVDEPDDVTRRIVDINLHGPITGAKLAIERMTPRHSGHVVTVASAVGRVALAHAATYSATKYALVGLHEALRSELRGSGIDVSVVLPMITNTDLGAGLRKVRGQRTVEPAEVAEAIVSVIAEPRFETWVPASAQRLYAVMRNVPRGMQDAISRRMGAADLFVTSEKQARAEYESRVRGSGASGAGTANPAAADPGTGSVAAG